MDRSETIEEIVRNTLQPCKAVGDVLSEIVSHDDDYARIKELISIVKSTNIVAKNNESIEKTINILKNLANSK